MRRNKHSLSHYHLSTFDMGQLIPVANFEVLPGDSIRMSTSCLLRVSPLLTPVMHPVVVRLHHWFVPYRILDSNWETFITGGPDGLGSTVPQFTSGANAAKEIGDYFGIPLITYSANLPANAFVFRAYNEIWNEFYRDPDLETEISVANQAVQNVAWEKDYFTSARPWTQKGPAVVVPLGSQATVRTAASPLVTGAQSAVTHKATPGTTITGTFAAGFATGGGLIRTTTGATQAEAVYPDNLYADLATATGANINDVRRAFALQRYQEARAQYGSKYTDYLRYLGIRSSDARLQRPEYLGGGRATVSFSEVLRTGGDTDTGAQPIGELKGHGIAAVRSRRWVRFFEEHGVVLTLCSLRPKAMYPDGLNRKWTRTTKEDFWQMELERIGQQAVLNREVRATHAAPTGTFGYQDRYAEYRHEPSYVSAEFRSTLADWHLARLFASDPALNADFVKCVPSKRIHAEQTQNSIWGMFSHSIQARRLVGQGGKPGRIM